MGNSGLLREILVCYDIEDDRTRTRLFKALKALGLRSVQKSVFWGFVTSAEHSAIRREINNHVIEATDRALVIPVRLSAAAADSTIGYTASTFSPPSNYEII